ncbi:16269_t:CDS:2 [Entrophospora sp. SA101]|nr:16269_t:CDS:2 [Entrophospora sp. SA101]CAJ0859022.1 9626_t:CDS:2 [Entrophospora sp. SA101]
MVRNNLKFLWAFILCNFFSKCPSHDGARCTLISIVAYGGRVDNEFDKRLLDNFVGNLFTPASYDLSFPLVKSSDDSEKLLIPEGSKIDQFMEWVNKLPDNEPPSWLGLQGNAERQMQCLSKFVR